jgi:cob(I)alamin adenosyltransferase
LERYRHVLKKLADQYDSNIIWQSVPLRQVFRLSRDQYHSTAIGINGITLVDTKIYTKSGDEGMTGMLSSRRVFKDHARIDAYGTVDELNACVGLIRAESLSAELDQMLKVIQSDLFDLGSALADPDPKGRFFHAIKMVHVQRLERHIDEMQARLSPLTSFILPGGTRAASLAHLARTICRRAERDVVGLSHVEHEPVDPITIVYLNRLSDFPFVFARMVNHSAGVADVPWTPS